MKPTLILMFGSVCSLQAVTIVDDFNTYPGSGSDAGWVDAWNSPTISNNGSSTVKTTNPVNNGGSYIEQVTSQLVGAGAGNRAMIRRIDSNVISTVSAYTISWDIRIDDISSVNVGTAGFSTFTDRFHIMMNTDGNAGSGVSSSWLVGAVGADRSSSGNWYFYNNSGTTDGSFNNADLLNTGVAITEGHTYSFNLSVDPSSKTYAATITDLENSATQSASGLNFRNQDAGDSHEYLVFGTNVEADEYRGFSVDNIVITGVPEPSTTALSLLALTALCLKRRRA